MNYLPSKELLSEVLGHKIWKVLDCNMGTLRYCIYPNKEDEPSEYMFPINIHELAYKCKEWAFYAYKISVSSFKSGSFYLKEFNQIKDNSEYWVELDTASIDCEININDSGIFKSYSEPEAIFKACEWILKENNENK